MAWRFRRSVKLLPGVHWNIGKKSTSITVGPRGGKMTFGTRGASGTVSLPGTGLSFTQRLGTAASLRTEPVAQVSLNADPARFCIVVSRWRTRFFFGFVGFSIIAAVALGVPIKATALVPGFALLAALVCLLLTVLTPSAQTLASRELFRRIARFRQKATDVLGTEPERSALQGLLDERNALGLSESEAGPEVIEAVTTAIELHQLEDDLAKAGGRLPEIAGYEDLTRSSPCFFTSEAFLEKRGPDEDGRVLLTRDGVLFYGASMTSVPWAKVAVFKSGGECAVIVQRSDRQTPYTLWLPSISLAMKATFIGNYIRAAARAS